MPANSMASIISLMAAPNLVFLLTLPYVRAAGGPPISSSTSSSASTALSFSTSTITDLSTSSSTSTAPSFSTSTITARSTSTSTVTGTLPSTSTITVTSSSTSSSTSASTSISTSISASSSASSSTSASTSTADGANTMGTADNTGPGDSSISCYYTNRQYEPKHVNCGGAACCQIGSLCMSNGLCFNSDFTSYTMGTCTDRTWGLPDCPKFCVQDVYAPAIYNVTFCGNDGSKDTWCCTSTEGLDCCNDKAVLKQYTAASAVAFAVTPSPSVKSLKPFSDIDTDKVGPAVITTASASLTARASSALRQVTASSSRSSTTSSTSYWTSYSESGGDITLLTSGGVVYTLPSSAGGDPPYTWTLLSGSTISTSSATETANVTAMSGTHRSTATIAGVAVGVPVGLVAIALLFYILRRRHQHKKKGSDSTSTSDAEIHQKAELDAQSTPVEKAKVDTKPDTIGELDNGSDQVPRELDADSNMLAELPDTFAELDSHPVAANHFPSELDAVSDYSRDVSPITTGNDTRWSVVSSLATPSDHYPASAGVAPIGIGLQAAERDLALHKDVHRLRSPLSRMMPVDEAASSQTSLSPELQSDGRVELGKGAVGSENADGGKQSPEAITGQGGADSLGTTQKAQTEAESTTTPKHEAAPHGERQNWAESAHGSEGSSHQHMHSHHSHGAW